MLKFISTTSLVLPLVAAAAAAHAGSFPRRPSASASTRSPSAQPPENWEIKNEAGTVLDPEKRVGEYHFGKEVTLFLSLKAGAAG